MPRPTPTRAIRTCLIIALFASAACGRSVTTTTTTTPPAQRDPRMATVFVDVAPLLTHVSRYRVGPRHSYLHPARETGRQVRVEIGALGTSIDIDPLNGPQGFRVIGVVENKDLQYTEAEFGLKPRTRYLIWVAPGTVNSRNNSRTRWGLLEYPRTQQGVVPSQPLGYVLWCHNYPNREGTLSDVDFKEQATCNVNVAADSNPFRFASFTSGREVGDSEGRGLAMPGPVPWFLCSTGCCYGSAQF